MPATNHYLIKDYVRCDNRQFTSYESWIQENIDKSTYVFLKASGVEGYSAPIRLKNNSWTSQADASTDVKDCEIIYETEEPKVYILDENITFPIVYKIDDYGTEEQITNDYTLPAILTSVYGVNATDTIRNLPKNYINTNSCTNLVNALGGGTTTWDSSTNSYKFNLPNIITSAKLNNELLSNLAFLQSYKQVSTPYIDWSIRFCYGEISDGDHNFWFPTPASVPCGRTVEMYLTVAHNATINFTGIPCNVKSITINTGEYCKIVTTFVGTFPSGQVVVEATKLTV